MTGFKNFVLRGNLVDTAVAFVIGVAFASVVTSFTDVFTAVIGKIFGSDNPTFTSWHPGGIPLGAFLTAVIAFLLLAAVVYFFVVVPYTKAKEKFFPSEPEGTPADIALLEQIRDAIQAKGI